MVVTYSAYIAVQMALKAFRSEGEFSFEFIQASNVQPLFLPWVRLSRD